MVSALTLSANEAQIFEPVKMPARCGRHDPCTVRKLLGGLSAPIEQRQKYPRARLIDEKRPDRGQVGALQTQKSPTAVWREGEDVAYVSCRPDYQQ